MILQPLSSLCVCVCVLRVPDEVKKTVAHTETVRLKTSFCHHTCMYLHHLIGIMFAHYNVVYKNTLLSQG